MAQGADRLWVGSMPEAYDRGLAAAVFRPFAADLAGRAAAHRPGRVLELAAGTGALTRELVAALPDAQVTATDLNDAMVDFGRERAPGAVWRQADAMALAFDDASFDLVACQFGVMFFPDKQGAFTEVRRVLAPHGAFLFNAWAEVDAHDFQAAITVGLERAFPENPPTFMVAVPHGYPDLDVARADLEAAGFECTVAERVTLDGTAPSAHDLARGYCLGTPIRAAIDDARMDAVIDTLAQAIEERLGIEAGGPVTGRMAAIVLEACPA